MWVILLRHVNAKTSLQCFGLCLSLVLYSSARLFTLCHLVDTVRGSLLHWQGFNPLIVPLGLYLTRSVSVDLKETTLLQWTKTNVFIFFPLSHFTSTYPELFFTIWIRYSNIWRVDGFGITRKPLFSAVQWYFHTHICLIIVREKTDTDVKKEIYANQHVIFIQIHLLCCTNHCGWCLSSVEPFC